MNRKTMPAVALWAAALAGCGGGGEGDAVAVRGTVTLDGKALPGAVVTFTPTGSTRGVGGRGRTGPDGGYTLQGLRGGSGVPAGTYQVTVSKLMLPDGSDFPENSPVSPIDSRATEQLPAVYSDPNQTALSANVPAGGGAVDFPLKRQGK